MRRPVLCALPLVVFVFLPATADDVREDFAWLTPRGFQMRAPAVPPETFFETYREAFELTDDDELVVTRSAAGAAKVEQRHASVPVIGGEYVLVTDRNGKVVAGTGLLGTRLPPARARLAESDAIDHARVETVRRLRDSEVAEATATLVYAPTDASFAAHVLAYRVQLVLPRSARTVTVDVDAATGAIRWFSENIARWTPVHMTGWHLYDGLVDFRAEEENGMCRLHGGDVITHDQHGATMEGLGQATIVESACSFDDPDVRRFVSAHYGVDAALRYFFDEHGRVGHDGAGGTLKVYVDYGDGPTAFFAKYDGGFIGVRQPSTEVALDVMGHETTHAVIAASITSNTTIGLYEHGEPGALDEGISDIFGTLVEFAHSADPNWSMNEDVVLYRRLDQPHLDGNPDTYLGTGWMDPAIADDVHVNSTVVGHWFYLLANGGLGTNDFGQPYSVSPAGRELGGKLVYEMVTGSSSSVPLLSYGSNFENAAHASSLAAKNLCGEASLLHVSSIAAWNAVAVPVPPTTTYAIEPVPGAVISPWPAELRWQVAPGETEWVVQISSSPMFDTGVHETQLTTVENVGGVAWAKVTQDLAPSTLYYWRVRAVRANGFTDCWRPTSIFVTDARPVTLVSPMRGELDVYPWDLDLVWKAVASGPIGTLGLEYEVAVHLSQSCSDTPFIATTTSETSLVVDVYVKSGHAWRVRATKSGFVGAWSDCSTFSTAMPEAKILAPTSGQYINPWSFELHWQPVKGVRGYLVESTRDREGVGGGVDVYSVEVGVVDRFAYDLVPALTYMQQQQWWRITPLGPLPLDEKGKHDDASYINHGDGTIPQTLAPHAWGDPPWFTVGADVKFRWKTIKHATAYEISIYPLKKELQGTKFFVQWSDRKARIEVPAASGDEQTFVGAWKDFTAPDEDLAGFLYSVRAIGPNGLSPIDPGEVPGQLHANASVAHPGDGLYLMRPEQIRATGSQLVFGASGNVLWNGGLSNRFLVLDATQFQHPWSPTGEFYYQLHSGWDCSNKIGSEIGGSMVATYDLDKPGKPYSYRVRAIGDYPTYNLNIPNHGWSNCFNFTTASTAEHDPDPAPEPSFGCSTDVVWGQNITDPTQHSFYIEMGTNVGETTLDYTLYTIKDAITVWHDDQLIGEVPCGNGSGTIPLSWAGGQDWIEVRVQSNCAGTSDTDWEFIVHCP